MRPSLRGALLPGKEVRCDLVDGAFHAPPCFVPEGVHRVGFPTAMEVEKWMREAMEMV